mgnify:FL=1
METAIICGTVALVASLFAYAFLKSDEREHVRQLRAAVADETDARLADHERHIAAIAAEQREHASALGRVAVVEERVRTVEAGLAAYAGLADRVRKAEEDVARVKTAAAGFSAR